MDHGFETRVKAREHYRPRPVKWLLVAEAPPDNHGRYFYFEHCDMHDYLFLETIHVIYRDEYPEITVRSREGNRIDCWKPNSRVLRDWKHPFLCQFKQDGFFLIDAVESPIPKKDKRRCKSIVRRNLPDLAARMSNLVTKETRVILIKRSVCALKDQLVAQGFKVVNRDFIVPFPDQHWQPDFRREMHEILRPYLEQKREVKQVTDLPQCPYPDI